MSVNINGRRAKSLVSKGAILVDTRDPISFRDGTIPGALNYQLRKISELIKLPRETTLILFGEGYDDENVIAGASYLTQYGFSNVYSLGSKDNIDK
jgi:rhodanese-related sulfurtransferase